MKIPCLNTPYCDCLLYLTTKTFITIPSTCATPKPLYAIRSGRQRALAPCDQLNLRNSRSKSGRQKSIPVTIVINSAITPRRQSRQTAPSPAPRPPWHSVVARHRVLSSSCLALAPPSPSHTPSADQHHRSIAPCPRPAPYRPRLTPRLVPVTSTPLERPSPRRPAR